VVARWRCIVALEGVGSEKVVRRERAAKLLYLETMENKGRKRGRKG
jgi:hypothetical protein